MSSDRTDMDIERAKSIIVSGDAKYGEATNMIYNWQYTHLEMLKNVGAITIDGFERMVAVPANRNLDADVSTAFRRYSSNGGKGGPWIGQRALTDAEVITASDVVSFVLAEALPPHRETGRQEGPSPMRELYCLHFHPFIAPCVFDTLYRYRATAVRNQGWLGRLLLATPLGRYLFPAGHTFIETLTALLRPLVDLEMEAEGGTKKSSVRPSSQAMP